MRWQVVLPEEQRVQRWSGGETRELYIAPTGASYAGRDFSLRLSSATVEEERSVFTKLPAYERQLVLLSGKICLRHDGSTPLVLLPLAVDSFDGGAVTHSHGRCRDFNVMLAKAAGYTAHCEAFSQVPEWFAGGNAVEFFFAAQGAFVLVSKELQLPIPEGALLRLEGAREAFALRPKGEGTRQLVHVVLKKANKKETVPV